MTLISSAMDKFIQFSLRALFALFFPLFGFISSWWISFLLGMEEKEVMISALTGLAAGILIILILVFLHRTAIYNLSNSILIFIYLFYNIVLFGFFMGVPIFHPILGISAGIYWVKKLQFQSIRANCSNGIRKISLFTAIVTGCICLLSAFIALMSKSTASDLKGMFQLSFEITRVHVNNIYCCRGMLIDFCSISPHFLYHEKDAEITIIKRCSCKSRTNSYLYKK